MAHSTEPSAYLIGVDGGGTKTAVALALADGTLLGRGVSTSSNYQKVGFKSASSAVLDGIADAWRAAGLDPLPVAAIVCGLSGVDTETDRARWLDWLARTMPASRRNVVNDAELALAAGTPDDIGVALICGTGAIAVGRNAAGAMLRADGWGYLLGDDGSGLSIGHHAMRHLLRAEDGRGPATALTQAVLRHWGLTTADELINFVYLQDASPATIASLAAVVNACAEAGDDVALQIMRTAGDEVAQTIQAVVRRLGLNDNGASAPFAMAGSVVLRSRLVQDFLLEAAQRRGLRLGPIAPVEEPVLGAVRLAQRLAAE